MQTHPNIYLDNASTTVIPKEVRDEIIDKFNAYGNPSSPHHLGQQAKADLEKARSGIAQNLKVLPEEIIFTSGATEGIFHTILSSVLDLGVKQIITSPLEHPSVLNSALKICTKFSIPLHHLKCDERGVLHCEELEPLLQKRKSLVCVMSIQNEFGNRYPTEEIGAMCRRYEAYYLCDSVQSIGKYFFYPKDHHTSFCVGSGHKFHAPKGIGFLYKDRSVKGFSMQTGGGQERGIRGGTENTIYAWALNQALTLSLSELPASLKKASDLKESLLLQLEEQKIPFRQLGDASPKSSPWIITICILGSHPLLLFKLSLQNVCVSGGSSCGSGTQKTSPIYEHLHIDSSKETLMRVSLSKYTSTEEITRFVEILSETLSK